MIIKWQTISVGTIMTNILFDHFEQGGNLPNFSIATLFFISNN